MKGETVEEIAAAAEVMRALASPVNVTDKTHLVDTCGTGGDAAHTFNISTTAAFVVAAAGARVAKHGNRSVSSKSGSADVLEAAGVNLELSAEQVGQCVDQIGVGFMFAPKHHAAMKHAIGPRREMGVRTIFNLLGPLTNPAGAPHQVLGVFSAEWLEPLAQVLGKLGSRHVLVVHAKDGLDEISIGAETEIAELRDGRVHRLTVWPEQFGLQRADIATLVVTSATDSLAMMKSVLDNRPGAARDIVLLNAGAAIYAAGLAATLGDGVVMARAAIESGAAKHKLEALVTLSQKLAGK
ncbi:MAG TPA: anthranilate phosphoribosyltransferase [Gammaproteobacteria bacterium]|nr:anthranilate phosphoribosyltransferase [Gammaproteobacteria bacterium]